MPMMLRSSRRITFTPYRHTASFTSCCESAPSTTSRSRSSSASVAAPAPARTNEARQMRRERVATRQACAPRPAGPQTRRPPCSPPPSPAASPVLLPAGLAFFLLLDRGGAGGTAPDRVLCRVASLCRVAIIVTAARARVLPCARVKMTGPPRDHPRASRKRARRRAGVRGGSREVLAT